MQFTHASRVAFVFFLAALFESTVYNDDLFLSSPLAHFDMLSAKYWARSVRSSAPLGYRKNTCLDVVLVQPSHGYTPVTRHVDVGVLAHLVDLLRAH